MRCSLFKLNRLSLRLLVLLIATALAGCSRSTLRASEFPSSRPVAGVGHGYFEYRLEAFVVPPKGWTMDPPKLGERHTHLAWISPTRDTAYGVIYATIPGFVPVALMPLRMLHDQVLERIMAAMKEDQGEARLLSKRWDAGADKMRFQAEGGLYRIDCVLTVRRYSAWTVYVGRLRQREENPREIATAEKARQATLVGLEAGRLTEPKRARRAVSPAQE